MNLFISESYCNNNNILYIRENLSNSIFKSGCDKISADKDRVYIKFTIEEEVFSVANEEILDKIGDIIAIDYKYRFFNERLKDLALGEKQRDLLITALISADFIDDKRYIRTKLKGCDKIAIDGFFNFRLANLKRKWEEITSFIPDFFTEKEMKEFVFYLLNEKKQKTVLIEGNKVYDNLGNRLKRASLIPTNNFPIVKEILLAGASEIILGKLPDDESEINYIKEFFGNKILFKSGEIL